MVDVQRGTMLQVRGAHSLSAGLAVVLLGLSVLTAVRPGVATSASAPGPTQAIVLTRTSIIRVDVASSRIVTTRAVGPGSARKVVHAGAFVALQRQRAVEILDPRTLDRLAAAEFSQDVRDVAAAGPLLFVAAGMDVHVLQVGRDAQASPQARVRLPKPADALTARGSRLFVIDDLATPLYAHLIDVSRPKTPATTPITWTDTNAHLRAQAVADRWYVLVGYTTIQERGQYLVILPARPPLRELGRRVVALERKPVRPAAPVAHFVEEFRVHRRSVGQNPLLLGVARAGDQVWLVSRSLDREGAIIERQMPLGAIGEFPHERRGAIELVGARLFVAAPSTLLALDVDPPSARITRFKTPTPILSFAIAEPTR